MIKKYSTPINIISVLWALLFVFISKEYHDYERYFIYLSIVAIIPFTIFNLIKQRREDQLNGTTMFKSSIYRMLVMAIVLVVFFLLTMQPDVSV